ncbi:MAG: TatD family hydrolase [Propionibacteriaceae bacterium]|nr:TatD family hydrolase [Propionibacteriaceae bacterium]
MTSLPPAPPPLPAPTVDAHTHLGYTVAKTRQAAADIIQAAHDVGITKIVDVGCDVASAKESIAFAERFESVISCISIHPNDAARLGQRLPEALAEIAALIPSSSKVRGIGETGLDYFRTTDPEGQARQRHSFAQHIEWAKVHQLPLVIHDRDAHADILAVLDSETPPAKVMMHCFSGDAAFAKACLDRGWWLSFPGTITFNANTELREALRLVPQDRILVETDAPYLTPMPHRGKTNGSYLLPHTVSFMAEFLERDLAELCNQVSENAFALFGEW